MLADDLRDGDNQVAAVGAWMESNRGERIVYKCVCITRIRLASGDAPCPLAGDTSTAPRKIRAISSLNTAVSIDNPRLTRYCFRVSAESATDDSRQLPRGRHGLTRGAVVAHQRRRLLRAVPAAACAKGYLALTVEDICAEAGVSRRTFYENFRDKEDCFITAYRQCNDELIAVVTGAASVGGEWQERARFAIGALLEFLASRPAVARMAVIEVMAAGPAAIAERDRAVAMISSLIGEEGFSLVADPAPPLLLRMIAGAALELIYGRVLAGRAAELEQLQPMLMYLVLVALRGPSGAAVAAGLLPDRRISG